MGEDGIQGIALSVKAPGASFLAFQQAILDHYNRGVILAINSRNNPEDAWQVIRNHPDMILKENHFAATRINWNDKAENIRELAKELNIGLDSMVFIDDDPTNRELVRSLVPEVEVPELPKNPLEYTSFLNSLNYFDSLVITDEDKMRGNLYVTERLRKEEEKIHSTKEDFLKSLCLELRVFEDDDSCLPRLSQLTEKTNQFNILKKPLSETELALYIHDAKHKVFYAKLHDKFGDYGIIAFALIDIKDKEWHIRSLLLSCRAFGRGAEDAFLEAILNAAREAKVTFLSIIVEETAKNVPARDFVKKYFDNGMLTLSESSYRPEWIKTIYENI